MRLLIWHVDSFRAEPTERGRSKVADGDPRAVAVEDALVVFAAAEKQDEPTPEAVAERATAAIEEVSRQMGARTVVLHSFAHLFVELSTPATAREILNMIEQRLAADGFTVSQSACEWFNHPYSSSDALTPAPVHRYPLDTATSYRPAAYSPLI